MLCLETKKWMLNEMCSSIQSKKDVAHGAKGILCNATEATSEEKGKGKGGGGGGEQLSKANRGGRRARPTAGGGDAGRTRGYSAAPCGADGWAGRRAMALGAFTWPGQTRRGHALLALAAGARGFRRRRNQTSGAR
jgi:hypothetical protein